MYMCECMHVCMYVSIYTCICVNAYMCTPHPYHTFLSQLSVNRKPLGGFHILVIINNATISIGVRASF